MYVLIDIFVLAQQGQELGDGLAEDSEDQRQVFKEDFGCGGLTQLYADGTQEEKYRQVCVFGDVYAVPKAKTCLKYKTRVFGTDKLLALILLHLSYLSL